MTDVPRLTQSAAVLLVRDVSASAAHYRDALGFSYDRLWGEPPGFVILRRDAVVLMLNQADAPVTHGQAGVDIWGAYFWVENVDALHADFVRCGATIDYGLCDQPYGCREFGVRDLDGHDIGFGQIMADTD